MSQLNLYKSFFYDQTRIWYSYKMSKQETYEVKEKLTLIIKHFYSTLSKVNLNNINFKIWLKWNCFHIYFNFLCKSTLVGVYWKWTNSYFYRNRWMSVKKGRKFDYRRKDLILLMLSFNINNWKYGTYKYLYFPTFR